MTKKDYELIAQTLVDAFTLLEQKEDGISENQRKTICLEFAKNLKNDNPRFSASKFGDACGFGFIAV